MSEVLKTSDRKALKYNYFPKKYMTVIWRNYETVPVENIAKALKTTVENIQSVAGLMGLKKENSPDNTFLKRGYLTIIRQNWHLLDYEQICTLLGIAPKDLAFILKEDDFMWHKMGHIKPDTQGTAFEIPIEEDITVLEEIKSVFNDPKICDYTENGFDFLKKYYDDTIVPIKRGSPEGFDIVLPDEFSTIYSNEEFIKIYAQDFCTTLEKRWGVKSCGTGNQKYLLEISIGELENGKSGSYKIDISRSSINVIGADEKGVYAGLKYLEKMMTENKGPYFNIGTIEKNTVFDIRYIYSYFALYGDALLDSDLDPYPDGLLRKLSDCGVNGIWMQAILYQLCEFPFDPELSIGYEKRRESLKKLIKKAKRYGIDIYLYFNEPRAMDETFYKKHPNLQGEREGDFYSLCTSCEQVKEYLYNGMKDLFSDIPDLAGYFTITMSENLTNCYSRSGGKEQSCPRCKERQPYDVVAEVNNIMARGAKAGNPDIKAIAWTWGWNPQWSEKVIRNLDDGIMLMCVNEEGMQPDISGYKPTVIDYTMTVPGPSERSINNWNIAKQTGRKTLSKVQLNCTWELAALPYLPLADICSCRIQNIKDQGVEGLMLSWTLGGCDSQNLDIASLYYYEPLDDNSYDRYFSRTYGEDVKNDVKRAQTIFCDAIKEFPFHLTVLYTAPQNYAPAAPFYEYKTGYTASMIGFPHDDIKTWKAIYSSEDFLKQFEKLVAKWEIGLNILKNCKTDNEKFNELLNISKGVYYHYRSTVNHIKFVMVRDRLAENDFTKVTEIQLKNSILNTLADEKDVVMNMLEIRKNDSRTGYEASNHYFYTVANLKEKLLNIYYLSELYKIDCVENN